MGERERERKRERTREREIMLIIVDILKFELQMSCYLRSNLAIFLGKHIQQPKLTLNTEYFLNHDNLAFLPT